MSVPHTPEVTMGLEEFGVPLIVLKQVMLATGVFASSWDFQQ